MRVTNFENLDDENLKIIIHKAISTRILDIIGYKFTNSFFFQQLKEKIDQLIKQNDINLSIAQINIINCRGINLYMLNDLIEIIKNNKTFCNVVKLTLKNIEMTEQSAPILGKLLISTGSLKYLDISENLLGNEGVDLLFQYVFNNLTDQLSFFSLNLSNLYLIDLSDNNLSDIGLLTFSKFIIQIKKKYRNNNEKLSLKSLQLEKNNCSDKSVYYLSQLISIIKDTHNKNMTTSSTPYLSLDEVNLIGNVNISGKAYISLLGDPLTNSLSTLKKLSISGVKNLPNILYHLGEILMNFSILSCLEYLNVNMDYDMANEIITTSAKNLRVICCMYENNHKNPRNFDSIHQIVTNIMNNNENHSSHIPLDSLLSISIMHLGFGLLKSERNETIKMKKINLNILPKLLYNYLLTYQSQFLSINSTESSPSQNNLKEYQYYESYQSLKFLMQTHKFFNLPYYESIEAWLAKGIFEYENSPNGSTNSLSLYNPSSTLLNLNEQYDIYKKNNDSNHSQLNILSKEIMNLIEKGPLITEDIYSYTSINSTDRMLGQKEKSFKGSEGSPCYINKTNSKLSGNYDNSPYLTSAQTTTQSINTQVINTPGCIDEIKDAIEELTEKIRTRSIQRKQLLASKNIQTSQSDVFNGNTPDTNTDLTKSTISSMAINKNHLQGNKENHLIEEIPQDEHNDNEKDDLTIIDNSQLIFHLNNIINSSMSLLTAKNNYEGRSYLKNYENNIMQHPDAINDNFDSTPTPTATPLSTSTNNSKILPKENDIIDIIKEILLNQDNLTENEKKKFLLILLKFFHDANSNVNYVGNTNHLINNNAMSSINDNLNLNTMSTNSNSMNCINCVNCMNNTNTMNCMNCMKNLNNINNINSMASLNNNMNTLNHISTDNLNNLSSMNNMNTINYNSNLSNNNINNNNGLIFNRSFNNNINNDLDKKNISHTNDINHSKSYSTQYSPTSTISPTQNLENQKLSQINVIANFFDKDEFTPKLSDVKPDVKPNTPKNKNFYKIDNFSKERQSNNENSHNLCIDKINLLKENFSDIESNKINQDVNKVYYSTRLNKVEDRLGKIEKVLEVVERSESFKELKNDEFNNENIQRNDKEINFNKSPNNIQSKSLFNEEKSNFSPLNKFSNNREYFKSNIESKIESNPGKNYNNTCSNFNTVKQIDNQNQDPYLSPSIKKNKLNINPNLHEQETTNMELTDALNSISKKLESMEKKISKVEDFKFSQKIINDDSNNINRNSNINNELNQYTHHQAIINQPSLPAFSTSSYQNYYPIHQTNLNQIQPNIQMNPSIISNLNLTQATPQITQPLQSNIRQYFQNNRTHPINQQFNNYNTSNLPPLVQTSEQPINNTNCIQPIFHRTSPAIQNTPQLLDNIISSLHNQNLNNQTRLKQNSNVENVIQPQNNNLLVKNGINVSNSTQLGQINRLRLSSQLNKPKISTTSSYVKSNISINNMKHAIKDPAFKTSKLQQVFIPPPFPFQMPGYFQRSNIPSHTQILSEGSSKNNNVKTLRNGTLRI